MKTAEEIFKANQVLTVAKAKELKGKKIACTNPEYRANKPHVQEFIVGDIVSSWEYWGTQECDGFKSRQEYWESFMTEKQIDEKKTELYLLDSEKNYPQYSAHTKYDNWYNEPTFTGSDADREVYYIEISKTLELTRVFHQKNGKKLCDFLTNLTIEEVIKKNDFLKEPDRKIISTRKEIVTINDNLNCNEYFKNGILVCDWLDSKPDFYKDEKEWNEFYQKTTGNPLPKGGILR